MKVVGERGSCRIAVDELHHLGHGHEAVRSFPACRLPGRVVCQLGVSSRSELHRSVRHELPCAQATRTVTLVGLVMMSNTADRFCDWATSASISSASASASMSKRHLDVVEAVADRRDRRRGCPGCSSCPRPWP